MLGFLRGAPCTPAARADAAAAAALVFMKSRRRIVAPSRLSLWRPHRQRQAAIHRLGEHWRLAHLGDGAAVAGERLAGVLCAGHRKHEDHRSSDWTVSSPKDYHRCAPESQIRGADAELTGACRRGRFVDTMDMVDWVDEDWQWPNGSL